MDQQYFQYPTPPQKPQRKTKKSTFVWVCLVVALISYFLGCVTMLVYSFPYDQLIPTFEFNPPHDTQTGDLPSATASPAPTPYTPGTWKPSDQQPLDNATIPEINRRVSPSIVGIVNRVRRMDRFQTLAEVDAGSGSGIIISADGYIVTNCHVIEGATNIIVTLKGGDELPAELIGKDSRSDIAVLKIDRTDLIPIIMGNSEIVEVGETAIAIGNPLGDLVGTLTAGVISGVNREVEMDGYKQTLLQTDAAINPGNSGGALVNIRGELIGINSLKSIYAGFDDYGNPIAAEGIGFAIPSNTVVPIIEALITNGMIERPGIGIYGHAVTETESADLKIPMGIYIVDVIRNGPADDAGIMQGDVLLTFNGAELTDFAVLTNMLDACHIGDEVRLDVWRNGREYICDVILAQLDN